MDRHDKLVGQIEKKMMGASMFKSEQEKKEQIFEYESAHENEFRGGRQLKRGTRKDGIIDNAEAERSLEDIYNFYVNSYIQPRQHYETFEKVNERRLTFQPFILFMKNFGLLKVIFPLDKIKLYFKKFSNFGQYLTAENFIFLINELSHEEESRQFFEVQRIRQRENIDLEMIDELEKQQLYFYMELEDPSRYRRKFTSLFEPFNCHSKPELSKKKYSYRKFSLPELRKKALPNPKGKTVEKDLFVVKQKANLDQQLSPFQKAKSIFVSWEILRSKSVAHLQSQSEQLVKQKYVKEEPDDSIYLREFSEKEQSLRKNIEKKISQATEQQMVKNRLLMAKLQGSPHRSLLNEKELKARPN